MDKLKWKDPVKEPPPDNEECLTVYFYDDKHPIYSIDEWRSRHKEWRHQGHPKKYVLLPDLLRMVGE